MEDRSMQIKVGALILVALALLVGFVLIIGDVSLARHFTVLVDYRFSGGIQEGAPVKIAGIKVGRVKEVLFLGAEEGGAAAMGADPDIQVRVVAQIEERAHGAVRRDAEFFINTHGVLGERYLEVVPRKGRGEKLPDGAVVRGTDPPRTDLLLSRLFEFLDGIGHVLRDNKEAFGRLLEAGSGLAGTLDEVLQENRREISAIIQETATAAVKLSSLVGDLQVMAAKVDRGLGSPEEVSQALADMREVVGRLRADLPQLSERTQKTLARLDSLIEAAEGAAGEDGAKLKEGMAHLLEVGRRAEKIAQRLDRLLARIEQGKGTAGAILKDEEIYDDLKEMLRDLKQHPWKMVWKE